MIGRGRIYVALALAAVSVLVDVRESQAGMAPTFSGSLTMTSDEGDYIGQGESYSFPGRALTLGPAQDGIAVGVLTNDRWHISLVAPSAPDGSRQRLKEGVYKNAQRFADVLHPGLDVGGAGRGCNESTGRFTVIKVKYGPHGYVRSLHATFEQHCEGREPAMRGEIMIKASPPPPPLKLRLTFDPSRTSLGADGIRIGGTLACTQTVDTAAVSAEVSETFAGGAVGSGNISLPTCGPSPRRWEMTAASSNGVSYTADRVRVVLHAGAADAFYTAYLGGGAVNVELPSREVALAGGAEPGSDSDSKPSDQPSWTLVIVLVIVATAGWTIVIARWFGSAARRRPS